MFKKKSNEEILFELFTQEELKQNFVLLKKNQIYFNLTLWASKNLFHQHMCFEL